MAPPENAHYISRWTGNANRCDGPGAKDKMWILLFVSALSKNSLHSTTIYFPLIVQVQLGVQWWLEWDGIGLPPITCSHVATDLPYRSSVCLSQELIVNKYVTFEGVKMNLYFVRMVEFDSKRDNTQLQKSIEMRVVS